MEGCAEEPVWPAWGWSHGLYNGRLGENVFDIFSKVWLRGTPEVIDAYLMGLRGFVGPKAILNYRSREVFRDSQIIFDDGLAADWRNLYLLTGVPDECCSSTSPAQHPATKASIKLWR